MWGRILLTEGGFQLLGDGGWGRNPALVDPSTRHVERRFRGGHSKDVLPFPKQRRRRIARPHVRLPQLANVDVLVIRWPAERLERIVEVVHHVGGVYAPVAREERQVLHRRWRGRRDRAPNRDENAHPEESQHAANITANRSFAKRAAHHAAGRVPSSGRRSRV